MGRANIYSGNVRGNEGMNPRRGVKSALSVPPNFVTLLQLVLVSVAASALLPASSGAQYPGLYEEDGSPHPHPPPNAVRGASLNVLSFGADPTDSEHDDLPAIRAALEAARAGDEIFFPAGFYNFRSTASGDSRTHIYLKSGVNLRGDGRESTFLKSAYGDATVERFLRLRGISQVVISDLTLTADFRGAYSRNTEANNPQGGGPRYAICIEDASGSPSHSIVIENVGVENFRGHGVRVQNSYDVVVRGCVFRNATDVGPGGAGYGVCILGNGLPNNNSKFNLVEGCSFYGPYLRHGVLLQYATHNNLVQGNFFDGILLDAIDLHGEDEYLNEIRENEIRNVATGAGVGVGNTGSTHDASGPYNYIHHNRVINCREGVKIYLGSPDTRVEYNEITGSQVTGGKGIYLLNAPRAFVKGNWIHDNPAPGFIGILLAHDPGTEGRGVGDPTDIWLVENRVHGNAYGIRILAGKGIVLENNDVYSNGVDFYSAVPVAHHKRLEVSVDGLGTVVLNPPGGSYPIGSTVELYAQRGPNWRFDHWEGDLSGSFNPTSLVVDDNKRVVAVFVFDPALDEVALHVQVVGQGRVELDPPGGIYPRGSRVTVQAVPATGWHFVGWEKGLAGSSLRDSLFLTQDTLVIARFAPLPRVQLALWVNGRGRVELHPRGGTYFVGDTVTLVAVPEEGWQFTGWGGDLSGNANPATLVMDRDKVVIAEFQPLLAVQSPTEVPSEFTLFPNFPNPFNLGTILRLGVPEPCAAKITIYDAHGKWVASPLDRTLQPGFYQIWFDARELASGVYVVVAEAGNWRSVRRMVLIR
ncbi:MAG: right-handed parallel beta-helix repeat-containing protein [candidate division KSB1 bacterium]|nr:right-handed parallel beta-helix repeat-containing protein [candidate division KSB1 bacterium]